MHVEPAHSHRTFSSMKKLNVVLNNFSDYTVHIHQLNNETDMRQINLKLTMQLMVKFKWLRDGTA